MNETTLLRYADPAMAAAIEASFLGTFRAATLEEIVRRGIVTQISSGHVFIEEGQVDWAGILLVGMARVYLTTSEGRQVTLRHVRPGGAVGIPCVVGKENPVRVATLTECRLLRLNVSHLRLLAERDASVALALATEVTQRLLETCAEVEFRLESSVRQRVARWLLELAPPIAEGGGILISQEALAQSVGTAREVVSKVLLDLQRDGIISLRRGLISVRNVVGLQAIGEAAGRRLSTSRSPQLV